VSVVFVGLNRLSHWWVSKISMVRNAAWKCGCQTRRSRHSKDHQDPGSTQHRRCGFVVGIAGRVLSAREPSKGALQTIETSLGRPEIRASSRAARTNEGRRPSVKRCWRSASRHVQQRSCSLLAEWLIMAAYFLAARRLLSPMAARIAVRWSEWLAKKSLAIWLSERRLARRKSERT
jgi:hypothetical protein